MTGRLALVVGALVLGLVVPAGSQVWPPDAFVDDDGSVHEANIDIIATLDITRGCNPPLNDAFCPNDTVTRGQMAAFLRRALGLPAATSDHFADDDTSVFEGDINAIAEAGVTQGCNPPANDRYCPDSGVTRAQMATFLVRAFELVAAPPDPHLDFVLAFSGDCNTNQTTCVNTIAFPAATEWPIDEGWFYQLPYLPGDEEALAASNTRFRAWLDGVELNLRARPVDTIDGRAIKRFTGTLPALPAGSVHTLVGEWTWEGAVLYRTELTVEVP